VTVVCLTIGLSFLSLGLWLVLPFAGLEIFVVGVAVGYTIRRSSDCEIIFVEGAEVTITKCKERKTHQFSFQRYWVCIRLGQGSNRLQQSRLSLGSHGQFVEIGTDMTNDARSELAVGLKQVLRNEV